MRIGIRTRELWLPEVGVPELFFRVFPAKIPAKRGSIGELRVARCNWNCHLSNTLGLANQIAVSRKESAREGDCPGGKTRQIFSVFFLTFCLCSRACLT